MSKGQSDCPFFFMRRDTMQKEKWMLRNKLGDFAKISETFSVSAPCARLLVNRGLTAEEEIRHFLYPEFSDISPVTKLPGCEPVLSFLRKAVLTKQKIRVFGDYDVDGVTATFLCVSALKSLSADVDYRIPDRKTDGYGVSENMVREAIRDGVRVVLTVDNGITAVKQTEMLKEEGITVLITDHHEPQELLPSADAVCDPKLLPEGERLEICGAVVAAKLMDGLLNSFEIPGFIRKNIDIMALATVCDVMPLSGENRAIVKLGLAYLGKSGNFGLRKLMERCKVSPESVHSDTLGYILGPCVNALGRMEKADAGVELLLSKEAGEAETLSDRMFQVNEQRKGETAKQEKIALKHLSETDWESRKTTVCYLPDCPESIAGIVAGRIRRKVNRPVIVLTDSSDPEILKGSARSIEQVSIFDIINSCKDLTVKFGGHEQAAGLSIRKEDLEEFTRRIAEASDFPDEQLVPVRSIDIVLPLHLADERLIRETQLLEPFGNGNPAPLYALRDARLTGLKEVGKTTKYWKMTFLEAPLTSDPGENLGRAVVRSGLSFENFDEFREELVGKYGTECFSGLLAGRGELPVKILYRPRLNEFNGRTTLEISVEGIAL